MLKKLFYLALGLTSCIKLVNAEPVTAINNFTPEKYLGAWYEIARIPFFFENGCIAPTVANYKLNGDELDVTNHCHKSDGSYEQATGAAYFVESANIGKLKVTFVPSWLRFTHVGRGDYWILYTDYNYSLVGSPNHKYLWILARSEQANPEKIAELLAIAKQQGFDIKQLEFNYPQLNPESSALKQTESK